MLNIEVKILDTTKLSIDELLSSKYLKQDLIKLERYRIDKVKKEKAASLLFKNKYIGKYFINEFGKPISNDIYFNISHSHGLVVFTKDKNPIGIDVEKVRDVDEKMINFISSDMEKEYIKNNINFYEIWTAKESLMKNIGTGIRTTIKDIPALPINGKKEYKDKKYYSKSIRYQDYIISVTRESDEDFDITLTFEN